MLISMAELDVKYTKRNEAFDINFPKCICGTGSCLLLWEREIGEFPGRVMFRLAPWSF